METPTNPQSAREIAAWDAILDELERRRLARLATNATPEQTDEAK